MPKYEITGSFDIDGEERDFTQEVDAPNDDVARERVYANLGSRHRLKRTKIQVEGVEEVVEA